MLSADVIASECTVLRPVGSVLGEGKWISVKVLLKLSLDVTADCVKIGPGALIGVRPL